MLISRRRFEAAKRSHEAQKRLRIFRPKSNERPQLEAVSSCDDDGPFRPGGRQQLVTVRLAGDDVADYFDVGGHFDVWMGDDVGRGVVTRRLFV